VTAPTVIFRGDPALRTTPITISAVESERLAPTKADMEYEYIDTLEALQALAARLEGEPILGIDTEAAGYHRYLDRMSLVQISTRDDHFLVDPLAVDDLSSLAPLMTDPSVEKIFHDADFDLRIMDRDAGLSVRGLFDTQIAAAFLGERQLGLGAIIEKFLGVKLPKLYQRADWAERPLTEGMKDYAVTDTAYLPPLRDALRAQLVELGRLEWAREEFARREETRHAEPGDEREAFLKVKGARDLQPRGLAILRELYGWRDEVAEQRDQATFRVLGNQTLIALSLQPPANAQELSKVDGLSQGLADRRGRDIFAAIQRGLAVPDDELPRFPPARRWDRDPDVEARSERLRDARGRVAEELGLDPGFLISRAVLDEIARRNPKSVDELLEIPDVRRWQQRTLGDAILKAL
jgi:ribonuclease D